MKTRTTRTDPMSNKLTTKRAKKPASITFGWRRFDEQVAEAHKEFFRKRKIDPPATRLAGTHFGKQAKEQT